VTELVWRGYQDQALDLRGQCDLGRDPTKLGEGGWLSMEYADPDDMNMRHCGSVISGLPPSTKQESPPVVNDEQVVSNFCYYNLFQILIWSVSACYLECERAKQKTSRVSQRRSGQTETEEKNPKEQRLCTELSLKENAAETGP